MSNNLKIIVMLAALCAAGVSLFIGLKGKAGKADAPQKQTQKAQPKGRPVAKAVAAQAEPSGAAAPKGQPLAQGRKSLSRRTDTGTVAQAASGLVSTNGAPKVAKVRTQDERDAAAMRELLDTGDEKGALRMARGLMGSDDAEVRSRVVSTLGWLGTKALPELTQMLSDPDEDIAADAMRQWEMAIEEIEDPVSKAELLVMAVNGAKSESDMESLMMTFTQLPEDIAVRSLVQIIQTGSTAGEVAREQYSFITGADFTTPEAAEVWIGTHVEPAEPAAP